MKVVFKGVLEESRKGCRVCGGRSFNLHLATHKTYFLPSGRRMTFRVGRPEEVTDAEAEFLLAEEYRDTKGKKQKAFELWQV